MSMLRRYLKLTFVFFIFFVLISSFFTSFWFELLIFDFGKINFKNVKLNWVKIEKKSLTPFCECRKETTIRLEEVNSNRINVHVVNINDSKTDSFNFHFNPNHLVTTCDLFNVFRRGLNQKIISYTVYGQDAFYVRYLKLIAQTAKKFYPDWIIRIYHNNSISRSFMCELECLRANDGYLDNVDFCDINELDFIEMNRLRVNFASILHTFWRWLPIGDDFVEVFLSRDSDFCVVERDKEAVDDWLKSGTRFHLMRGYFTKKFLKLR